MCCLCSTKINKTLLLATHSWAVPKQKLYAPHRVAAGSLDKSALICWPGMSYSAMHSGMYTFMC